ncbi:phospholipid-transporting ATPase ABCA1-like [Corythoichthys intestinalis]|uniref:phospholipid-transporting ATPase ABCA1-like n=1 Tax=Corythoichthys intestinalis TaxID=161448 RepID=UPI0025A5B36A|nr:phospholipid-transporting ATPase ABCA1-like [Corythoichthys intestinalis]
MSQVESTESSSILDNLNSAHCDEVTAVMKRMQNAAGTTKAIFLGKLLYTPDTPVVESVMKKIFAELKIFKDLKKKWLDLGSTLQQKGDDSLNLVIYKELTETITILDKLTKCLSDNKLEGVKNEDQMISRATDLKKENRFWAGVVFELPDSATDSLPSDVTYKIRMDRNIISSNKIYDKSPWEPGIPREESAYISSGFVHLQDMVEKALIEKLTNKTQNTGLYIKQMPYSCYRTDPLIWISDFIPIFLVLIWTFNITLMINGLVYEKEARLTETMKMNGLKTGTLWLGWFISGLVPFLLSILFIFILCKVFTIMPSSNGMVIFIFLMAFASATIMQCFLISTFFSNANRAAACGGLLYFCLSFAYIPFMSWQNIPSTTKFLASFLSHVALGFGLRHIINYNQIGDGVQWSSLQSSDGDPYNLLTCVVMLYVDAFSYATVAWYIDAVFPGEYGVPKPWNFIFNINYWRRFPLKNDMPVPTVLKLHNKDCIEADPTNLVLCVSICDLVKIYKKGGKMAVNHLDLKFYEGQITSLLGQNGAGKTTIMSVLIGLFSPTSGTVYIQGMDIRKDIDIIRRTLGFCPQHNVLFDNMTVQDHVWFYGRLRGMSEKEVKAGLNSWLKDVGLLHKRHVQTKLLSGGMKRKLSVAIAFIGASKVIVLDEPTAGIDPHSRQGIWDILLKYRKGRTIILATHYMDEAELLADRIAIISQGRLCCCGSLLFLKSKLGVDFTVTLVKEYPILKLELGCFSTNQSNIRGAMFGCSWYFTSSNGSFNWSYVRIQILGNFDFLWPMAALLSMVQRYFPRAKLMESSHEVAINIPQEDYKIRRMAVFLSELNQNLSTFGITSYGLSDSKLEDIFFMQRPCCLKLQRITTKMIFLRVAADTEDDAESEQQSDPSQRLQTLEGTRQRQIEPKIEQQVSDLLSGTQQGVILTGWRLTWQHLRALFIKRYLYFRRDLQGIFSQIGLPLFVLVVCLLATSYHAPQDGNLELHPCMYGEQYIFFSRESHLQASKIEDALLDLPGFSTKCRGNSILSHEDEIEQTEHPACQCKSKSKGFGVGEAVEDELFIFPGNGLFPDCPEGARPRQIYNRGRGIILQNLTSYNVSDYLINSYPHLIRKSLKIKMFIEELRYGGFSIMPGLPDYPVEKDNNVIIWHNTKGSHSLVSFVNVVNNGFLRQTLPGGSITATNHPLALEEKTDESAKHAILKEFVTRVSIIFAMSCVPASFVLFLIRERASKAKHLQFVSGVKPIIYWVANLFWDMINYTLSAMIVVLILISFQREEYIKAGNLPALVLLLLLYGWSIIPFMYPISFMFTLPSKGYIVLTTVSLAIGIISSLDLFHDSTKTNDIERILHIFPHYHLGRGLKRALLQIFEEVGGQPTIYSFNLEYDGRSLIAMAAESVIFFLFTILLEYKFFIHRSVHPCPKIPLVSEDEDVARERERVESGQANSDMLTMINLTKIYNDYSTVAVNQLCLGIPRGECFGLLGVNGAGKTTTFSMLTGDTMVSFGDAFLNHYSIVHKMDQLRQMMGYCPQIDAIWSLLTGIEHLELYARLRGVPEESVTKVAQLTVKKLGLSMCAKQKAKDYSGGNKRKLNTAIALIGAPPIIFLDEPTTGMDPLAKKFMWNYIRSLMKDGRSVVLSSHSMEECEALCNRIAIMVSGCFVCLGSVQHLKNRFGGGYIITFRLAESKEDTSQVIILMKEVFPMIKLRKQYHNVQQYELPANACSLPQVFEMLANIYEELGIREFSVSQTTLDQVFINFATKYIKNETRKPRATSWTQYGLKSASIHPEAPIPPQQSDSSTWQQE